MALPALSIEALPEEFFIDLAVGVLPFLDICDNYGIAEVDAVALESDPLFERRLRIATSVVEDDGTAFRSRCRVVVTESVQFVANMMRDTDVPASTQLEAFKTLVKYGGLEPKTDVLAGQGGPALTLNIIAPDGATHGFTPVVAINDQKRPVSRAVSTAVDGDFEELDMPELSILPPAASSLFGAS